MAQHWQGNPDQEQHQQLDRVQGRHWQHSGTEGGGSITCKLVKQVSGQCAGVLPRYLTTDSYGQYLSSDSNHYYFEGSTSSNYPTHDPCGKSQENHLKVVANPHGNIFIR